MNVKNINNRNEYKKYQRWFFRISHQMSMCFVYIYLWSVRVAERLVLPTSDHGVTGSNPTGGEILPEPKRRFIAQSLSCSPFHHLEMTEILSKGRKTLTHLSIHLPMLILSVDSDWLISIKVGQSLTGNRNYFYLHQSWSNFDQVHQSGLYTIKVSNVYTIKVSNQSPSKWTWSDFDQVNFDSINRLLRYLLDNNVLQYYFVSGFKACHPPWRSGRWKRYARPGPTHTGR